MNPAVHGYPNQQPVLAPAGATPGYTNQQPVSASGGTTLGYTNQQPAAAPADASPGYAHQQTMLAPAGAMPGYINQQPGLPPAGTTAAAYSSRQPGQPYIIYVVNQPDTGIGCSFKYPQYNGKVAAVFGGLQIFLGVLSVAMSSAVLGIGGYNMPWPYYVGYGIWSPVFWFIAGAFGLAAAKVKTKCTIITTMVMSIMSAVTISNYISLQSIAVSLSHYYYYYHNEDVATFALSIVLLIVCIAEGIIAILAASQCCKAVCCCNKNATAPLNLENPRTNVYNQAPVMQATAPTGLAYATAAPQYTQYTQDEVKTSVAAESRNQASPPPAYST